MLRKFLSVSFALLLAISFAAGPALAQAEEDLRNEIEALKQGQQNIQKQLNDIKKLLQAQKAPSRPSGPNVKDVVFNLTGAQIKGENTAKLTLIEFTDYQ